MFIIPLEPISSLTQVSSKNNIQQPESNVPFQNIFQEAIENVKETQKQVDSDIYDLVTGNTDDLHNLMINSTKATMSVELLVQLRNRALDAYSEVMRISV